MNSLSYRDYRYLRTRGRREKGDDEIEKELSLNPFTLFVVSFSVVAIEDGRIGEGVVVYISDLSEEPESLNVYYGEGRSLRVSLIPIRSEFVEGRLRELERELLKTFWDYVEEADRLVSFNGYGFDGYVLKIRSMLSGLDIPQRFIRDRGFHVDLLQFLSNGEREKRYTFDFVCRKFGIHTPKDIIDGSKVPEEFYKGYYRTVAQYNLKDSVALAQLYQRVRKYLEEEIVFEEPPTENQMRFLIDLLSQLTGISSERVQEIVLEFTGADKLNKRSVSLIIDMVKKLREA